jgi:hypothetical protein
MTQTGSEPMPLRTAWANIPPRCNRNKSICFSPYLYRARNLVERFFNRIKQCRRVATRYDKLAANYLALIQLASIRLWLRVDEFTSAIRNSTLGCGAGNVARETSGQSWLSAYCRYGRGNSGRAAARRSAHAARARRGCGAPCRWSCRWRRRRCRSVRRPRASFRRR